MRLRLVSCVPFFFLAFATGCEKQPTPPAATTPSVTTNATASATATVAAAKPGILSSANAVDPTSPLATAVGSALEVGGPAPDFSVTAHDDIKLSRTALKGKPIVVYFYPKDETPGCTKEACAFRDAWDGLAKSGVVLIGVSGDNLESHKAFAKNHKLPFHLVADEKGELAAKFGVPFRGGFAERQTFVIDREGRIKKIYRQVDVGTHAAQIVGDLR